MQLISPELLQANARRVVVLLLIDGFVLQQVHTVTHFLIIQVRPLLLYDT